jgi:hypothetical protein
MSDVNWRWAPVLIVWRAAIVGVLVAVVLGYDITITSDYELTDWAKRSLAAIFAVLIAADTIRIFRIAVRASRRARR